MLSDQASTHVTVSKEWPYVLASGDVTRYPSRLTVSYSFGFLHALKNLTCAVRNHSMTDGDGFYSMKLLLDLWNGSEELKTILSSKCSKF